MPSVLKLMAPLPSEPAPSMAPKLPAPVLSKLALGPGYLAMIEC